MEKSAGFLWLMFYNMIGDHTYNRMSDVQVNLYLSNYYYVKVTQIKITQFD